MKENDQEKETIDSLAPQQENEKEQVFNTRIIKKGILYFLIITIGALSYVFFTSDNVGDSFKTLKSIDLRYVLLAVALGFLDMLLGAWRNHIFARVIVPGISLRVCFNANLANIFMGAVTPSQSGGGPAQLYVFARNGINLLNGLTISLINWFSTLSFFPIAAFFSILLIKDRFSEQTLLYLLNFGFSIFLTLLVVVVVAFWKPIVVGQVVKKIGYWLGGFSQKWGDKILHW
ncbi:MAG: lysylphosphatidylglycerol synthase transmembrane domain-containing protein, partial [Bacteroidota bacterium]